MSELTQERLKELLKYDPETGIFTWLVGRKMAGKIAGSVNSEGYCQIGIKGKLHLAHRLAWIFVTGKVPCRQIDHRNGLKTENWFLNLRQCEGVQNQWNTKLRSDNKSGFKGVSWRKEIGKWQAQIRVFKVNTHIGFFDCPKEAGAAYESKARELHGEFYREQK
jgi:hypothetical protein